MRTQWLLMLVGTFACSCLHKGAVGDDAAVPLDGAVNDGSITTGLYLSPSAHDFGTVALGEQSTTPFVLHNATAQAVQVSGIAFVGANASDYALGSGSPDGGEANVDAGVATTIAAGDDYAFTVVFQPSTEGASTATITINAAVTTMPTASLTGMGQCPTTAPAHFDRPGVQAACGTPIFIAVGNQTRRMISSDGKTWIDQIDDRTDPNSMVSGCTTCDDDAFQAVFNDGLIVVASESGIYTSADGGGSWKKAPAPAPVGIVAGGGPHVAGVAYGNGLYLVANGETTYTSTDAYTWKTYTDGNPSDCNQIGRGALVFGNGHFFAICDAGQVHKATDDGVSWHSIVDSTTDEYLDAVFGNGKFLAVGNGFHASSTDGATWTVTHDTCADPSTYTGPASACLGALTHVTFDGAKFLACGSNGCLTSTDTITWTKVYTSSLSNLLSSGNGIYVANQNTQEIVTTTPTTWPAAIAFPSGTVNDVERVVFGYVLK